MQGTRTITDYFAAMQILWDEFVSLKPLPTCVCEGYFCNVVEWIRKKQEINLVICFLKGLNPSFSNVKSQIMATEPLPYMNKVFSLVLQYGREFMTTNEEPAGFQDIEAMAIRGYNEGFQNANGNY